MPYINVSCSVAAPVSLSCRLTIHETVFSHTKAWHVCPAASATPQGAGHKWLPSASLGSHPPPPHLSIQHPHLPPNCRETHTYVECVTIHNPCRSLKDCVCVRRAARQQHKPSSDACSNCCMHGWLLPHSAGHTVPVPRQNNTYFCFDSVFGTSAEAITEHINTGASAGTGCLLWLSKTSRTGRPHLSAQHSRCLCLKLTRSCFAMAVAAVECRAAVAAVLPAWTPKHFASMMGNPSSDVCVCNELVFCASRPARWQREELLAKMRTSSFDHLAVNHRIAQVIAHRNPTFVYMAVLTSPHSPSEGCE